MSTKEEIAATADKIVKEWADKGKLVEGGWQALVTVSGLLDAPEQQRKEMRKAYMLGAEHLFSCLMSILDPESEPTIDDMRRMSLIHKELETFRKSLSH
jgi:hypothetical protein